VIVVGSGAAGGQTAYTLAMEGVKVLMLEAGRNSRPRSKRTPMFRDQRPSSAPWHQHARQTLRFPRLHRRRRLGRSPVNPTPARRVTQPASLSHRSTRACRRPHQPLGPRPLRNGPYDFKPYSRDGLGFDWPIGYEDVAPYYDKVECSSVFTAPMTASKTPPTHPRAFSTAQAPRRPDSSSPSSAPRSSASPSSRSTGAVLSVKQDADTIPAKLHPKNPTAQRILAQSMRDRAACFWATSCGRGCSTRANYQSTTVHLPPALATGNLDILPNAMVRQVTMDENGKATGVICVDKVTGEERTLKARVVVLAASSAESVRILLNSKSARHPNGVANSSGLVGKYIMDTVGARLGGQIPLLEIFRDPQRRRRRRRPRLCPSGGSTRSNTPASWTSPAATTIEFQTGRQMPGARRRQPAVAGLTEPATAANSRKTPAATTARSSASRVAARSFPTTTRSAISIRP